VGTGRRPDGSNTINRPKKDFCPLAAIGPVLRQFQRKTYEVRIVGAGAVGSAWISNQPTNAVRFLTQLAHDCEIPCGSCCLARQQKPSRHGLEELSELIAIRFRPFEKPTTITNGQRQDFLFARVPKTSRRTICRCRRRYRAPTMPQWRRS
jgi:hypothetical protein